MKQQILQVIGRLIYQRDGERKSFVNENNETIYLYSFNGSSYANLNRSECSEIELLNGNKDFMKEIGDLYGEREIVALEITTEPGNEYLFKMPTLSIKMSEKENINSKAYIKSVGMDNPLYAIHEEVESIIWDAVNDREPVGTHTCIVKALISEKLLNTDIKKLIAYLEDDLNPYGYDPDDEGYDDDRTKTFVVVDIDDIVICGKDEKYPKCNGVCIHFNVREYNHNDVSLAVGDEVTEIIKNAVEDRLLVLGSMDDPNPIQLNRRISYITIDVEFPKTALKVPKHLMDKWLDTTIGEMEIGGYQALENYFKFKPNVEMNKNHVSLEITNKTERDRYEY